MSASAAIRFLKKFFPLSGCRSSSEEACKVLGRSARASRTGFRFQGLCQNTDRSSHVQAVRRSSRTCSVFFKSSSACCPHASAVLRVRVPGAGSRVRHSECECECEYEKPLGKTGTQSASVNRWPGWPSKKKSECSDQWRTPATDSYGRW